MGVTRQKLWPMFRIKQPEGDLTVELDRSRVVFLKVTTESERHTIRLLHLEDQNLGNPPQDISCTSDGLIL